MQGLLQPLVLLLLLHTVQKPPNALWTRWCFGVATSQSVPWGSFDLGRAELHSGASSDGGSTDNIMVISERDIFFFFFIAVNA